MMIPLEQPTRSVCPLGDQSIHVIGPGTIPYLQITKMNHPCPLAHSTQSCNKIETESQQSSVLETRLKEQETIYIYIGQAVLQ
jgi:hypothetical protein